MDMMFNYSVSWRFILYFMSMWEESIKNLLYKETYHKIHTFWHSWICICEHEHIPHKSLSQYLSLSVTVSVCSPGLLQWKLTSVWLYVLIFFCSRHTIFSCYPAWNLSSTLTQPPLHFFSNLFTKDVHRLLFRIKPYTNTDRNIRQHTILWQFKTTWMPTCCVLEKL